MTEDTPQPRSEAEIRQWLLDKLAAQLHLDPKDIDLDGPVVAHGMDSMQFVVVVGELEEWLGCRFLDNPLIDYPSVNALSRFLASQVRQGKMVIDPVGEDL